MAYVVHPTCQIPGLAKIYEDVFGPDFVGSFVEVGAFDGMTYSNTWGLANAGWTGIYIEPHPDFAARCAEVHKDNKNITVLPFACAEYEGTMPLTVWGEVSTGRLSKWNRDWGMDENSPRIQVPVRRLDQLITQKFDLLVIDVEEMEIEVLLGATGLQKPKMVIVELHEGQGTGPDQKGYQEPWVTEFHVEAGYRKIYADTINTIYVRES